MSEFLGTKGKWEYEITPEYHEPKCSRIEIVSNENETAWICKVQNNGVIGEQEGNANALLISKAPEMLDMLQTISQLQKDTYGDASGLHVTMIGISKQIDKLIKEATTLCETK